MDMSQPTSEDAPADEASDWQREAEAVTVNDDNLREFYKAALEESKYDSADFQAVHMFSSKAQATLDPRSITSANTLL